MAESNTLKNQETPYKDSHFLLFGLAADQVYDAAIGPEATMAYLQGEGIGESSLTQARRFRNKAQQYSAVPLATERYCDFCGRPLSGAEYETLHDGRDRCVPCSDSVIKKKDGYVLLMKQVRDGLCSKFNITLPSSIEVEVVSQKKLAKLAGSKYVPTNSFDPRAIGLAMKKGNDYSISFENGMPRISLISTAAHELTHIWQYSHWDWEAMQRKYGEAFLAVSEGMAKWAEIQYLYLTNETTQAERALENEVSRDDIYGYGLKLMLNHYPLSKGLYLEGKSPFMNTDCPVDLG